MATFTDQLKELFADCSDEGPTSLSAVLLAEIERVRDIIVVESDWDDLSQITRGDHAIELHKSYLAGDISLENCLWYKTRLEKEILSLGSPDDQKGRAAFHYQLACTELPLAGDWDEAEAVAGDLLCFMYLWYPDTPSKSTQRQMLEWLRYTLESRMRRLNGIPAGGARLRVSLLAA
jgi:hypothetical protein